MYNVLIACEESQRVATAFRERGFNAFSCDIQECSGGHPEYHIKGDVLPLLNGNTCFKTQSGEIETILGRWDLIIAHPPCTYLTRAANRAQSLKHYSDDQIVARTMKRIDAIKFFMSMRFADCDHIAIENPVGIMSATYRLPDQYIDPYYFAVDVNDTENYITKKTGLWLKGLPQLTRISFLPSPLDNAGYWSNGKRRNWTEGLHGSKARSKTAPGIAAAMAKQWGDYLINEC